MPHYPIPKITEKIKIKNKKINLNQTKKKYLDHIISKKFITNYFK